jgi:hypothetical protein
MNVNPQLPIFRQSPMNPLNTPSLPRRFMSMLVLAASFLCVARGAAAEIKHRFVATDESRKQLILVDQIDPSRDWTVPLPGNRDIRLVGHDRILVSVPTGYREYAVADGRLVKTVVHGRDIQSVVRDERGHTFLGSGKMIWELDAQDKEVSQLPITIKGGFRILTLTPEGHFMFVDGDNVVEVQRDGKPVRAFNLKTLDARTRSPYFGLRLPGGDTLCSTGYGASLLVLDAEGKLKRTIGGRDAVPGVFLNFFSTSLPLTGGGFLVCNWTGHQPQDGTKGPQLIQFDESGNIVWTWHDPVRAGSLHGVVLLP